MSVLFAMALGTFAAPGRAPFDLQTRARDDAQGVARLEQWLAAVGAHAAGTLDAAAIDIASWPEADLHAAVSDVDALARFLVRAHARFTRSGQRSTFTHRRRSFSMAEAQAILDLSDEEARRGDVSRLVTRAALLHTDLATLFEHEWDRVVPADASPRSSHTAILVLDGRQHGVGDKGPHWRVARALLDLMPADSPHAGIRSRWYVAAAAYMQSRSLMADMVPHVARAQQLFPADADILFYSGSMHESLAAPAIQHAVQEVRLPPGVKLDVVGERKHLQEARTLFARALEHNPDLSEARVRLGRVLGLSGRHEEAAGELQRAASDPANRVIQYYATLFLGQEQAILGRREAGRESFERAAALYPGAQSPRLALSRLAREAGDRAAAVAALQVLTVREDHPAREDPWWTYFAAREDEADLLLDQWRQSVAQIEER